MCAGRSSGRAAAARIESPTFPGLAGVPDGARGVREHGRRVVKGCEPLLVRTCACDRAGRASPYSWVRRSRRHAGARCVLWRQRRRRRRCLREPLLRGAAGVRRPRHGQLQREPRLRRGADLHGRRAVLQPDHATERVPRPGGLPLGRGRQRLRRSLHHLFAGDVVREPRRMQRRSAVRGDGLRLRRSRRDRLLRTARLPVGDGYGSSRQGVRRHAHGVRLAERPAVSDRPGLHVRGMLRHGHILLRVPKLGSVLVPAGMHLELLGTVVPGLS
jgi:hypothetical protein